MMHIWEEDIDKAMVATLRVAEKLKEDILPSYIEDWINPNFRYEHLEDMRQRFIKAIGTEDAFSETKANRWLAWMQAAVMALQNISMVYAAGYDHHEFSPNNDKHMTLDDFKEINRSL